LGEFPLTVKRQMIEALWKPYPVRMLCALLEVAPSSYYYTPLGRDDLSLLSQIEEVLVQFPTYGYRRVSVELGRRGAPVNLKRVWRVMAENDLLQQMVRGVRTTDSRHGYRRYPNLLQDCQVVRPDQVWCADITYIRLPKQYVYLAILLDVFTRSIRGWYLGPSLASELAVRALQAGLSQGRPEIHHSDQGIQYAATGYVTQLEALKVQISMAEAGQPEQNPYAERVIRTIKEEEVYLNDYRDLREAQENLGYFIEDVYQTKRIHSALGYLTPSEFEAHWRAQRRQEIETSGGNA
jgi:transposase InsO family protein